jgi:predicted dehydrogenase
LGAGGVAGVHAQAYTEIEGARLVAVADTDQAAADRLASQYGAQAYYDCQQLIDKAQIDVIDVCLPTFCSGRELGVEKPLDTRT